MRNQFAEVIHEIGRDDPRVYVLVADISPAGSIAKFREECPERFINVGVAEQSMIGICAGLALRGARPFAYTIATFALYRPFEMVRDDLCYQGLPVTVVGVGGGVVYSTLGGTHHAQEDLAIASALPGMTVLAPCDPLEVREATRYCALESPGPVYLRLGKAGEPNLTEGAEPFEFGRLRYLRRGSDVCILACGPILRTALEIADRLEERGRSVSVASVHTIKPLDREGIVAALEQHGHVLVIEEHAPHGGLGSRVKEIAWDAGARCRLQSFALQDRFIHCYGTHDDLLAAHGLETEAILSAIK